MKFFTDGDHLVITKDDFIDLQASPAVFYPLESETAKTVLKAGTIIALPMGNLIRICSLLRTLQAEAARRSTHGAALGLRKESTDASKKTNSENFQSVRRGK